MPYTSVSAGGRKYERKQNEECVYAKRKYKLQRQPEEAGT